MSKETGIVNIRGREYLTVALRVTRFRQQFPISDGWSLIMDPVEVGDVVRVRAQIVSPTGVVVAQDWAEERRGATMINKTSALENACTSAAGRCLAAAGFVGAEYASAEEVANAISQQAEVTDEELFGEETLKEMEEARQIIDKVIEKVDEKPKVEDPEDRKAASFAKAMYELTIQMAAILKNEKDPAKEASDRMFRILGTHGYSSLAEIKSSKARHTVHDSWAETVEAARKFAELA